VKLRGRASLNVKSLFNINKVLYNEINILLQEVIAFLFGDFYIIYKELSSTITSKSKPLD
jgi:hypothetical protein